MIKCFHMNIYYRSAENTQENYHRTRTVIRTAKGFCNREPAQLSDAWNSLRSKAQWCENLAAQSKMVFTTNQSRVSGRGYASDSTFSSPSGLQDVSYFRFGLGWVRAEKCKVSQEQIVVFPQCSRKPALEGPYPNHSCCTCPSTPLRRGSQFP
jgi:hypothetical protein